jgi:hypothetical protein
MNVKGSLMAEDMSMEPLESRFRVPGHPVTTALFVAACALIVLSTVYKYPRNSSIGLIIVAAGVPVYFFWSRLKGRTNG